MSGISTGRDRLTIACLSGHVCFVLNRRWPREAAVESLRSLAADRVDLLAEWAGILLGANDPRSGEWSAVTAQIGLLLEAGAQVDAIPGWALIGRSRRGSWAGRDWPPIPGLSEALGRPVTPDRYEAAESGHRGGWWNLVVHPLPHFRYGEDSYPALARAFGRVVPDGLGFEDRRHVRDEHRVVFGLRCRDALERLLELREAIAPLLPPGATTTLT